MNGVSTGGSAFGPLRHRTFAVLWTATVLGNVGTWMRDTTSGWLMTSLDPTPLMVALVQAAGMLPVFLLSLPAGALADIVDRRRLLLAMQICLGGVSLALALAYGAGLMTPGLLLAMTVLGGVGAALVGPAWQAIVPALVPRGELRPAVALNSLGFNISRAIGPALGGAVVATAGIAAAYAVDVVSYTLVCAALLWWRPPPRPEGRPERLAGAMRAGLRFALHHPPLRRVIVRALLFFVTGSAYWALLPLVARQQLAAGPDAYGLLLGALGAGAIVGAVALPALRRALGADGVVVAGTMLTAACTAGLALAGSLMQAVPLLLVAGLAWIAVLVTLNATAQALLPDWVRARGLALYLMAFFGAMTLGSASWGQVATLRGVDTALLLAAGAGLVVGLLAVPLHLPPADLDLTPSNHWPEPALATDIADDQPAWISITYRVAAQNHAAFAAALQPLARQRRRDGAIAWGVYADVAQPDRVVEWFVTPSWAEHMRQHGRVAAADRAAQDAVNALHEGPDAPVVAHHVALGRGLPPPGHDHHR